MSAPDSPLSERAAFVRAVPSCLSAIRTIILFGLIVFRFMSLPLSAADGQPDAVLTNKTGTVQYKPRDQPGFIPNAPDQLPLFARDSIRTLENSTAVVWVRNNQCSIKLRELSTLEILQQKNNSSPFIESAARRFVFFQPGLIP